jgi:hypothetical protein
VTISGASVTSKDGKALTLANTVIDAEGQTLKPTAVYVTQ